MSQPTPMQARSIRLAAIGLRRFLDTGNFIRFLVALVLAFGLWAWVTYENDPETTRTLGGIPVLLEDLQSESEVVGDPPLVDVQIRGAQSIIAPLERDSVQPYVEMVGISEPGEYELPVLTRTPSGVRVRDVIPETVIIEIDRIGERSGTPVSTVEPDDVPPNYQVREIEVRPETVTIRGPERSLDQVLSARLEVSIDGRTSSFSDSVPLIPVDSAGEEVSGVQVEPAEASVSVTIDVRGQVRKVIPVIVGDDALAPGHELVRTTVLPSDEIVVDGPEDDLAEIFFVTTFPIDISGWDESDVVRDVEIDTSRLPESVVIDNDMVHVSIEIRRQIHEREITGIPIDVMNPASGTEIRLDPATATVILEGSQSAIDAVSEDDVAVFVNIANAEPGSYELELRSIVPAQVQQREIQPPFVNVEVVLENDGNNLEGT